MENFDLMSLGQHCALPDCGTRDFLPFKCECCGKTFCLEHRGVAAHACPKADARAGTTLVCPLCARAVKVGPGEDPHTVFDAHMTQGCDPSNYAKVMRKKKCPVPGCKEKLTSINSYTCRQCSESVCLRHRFPGDHNCATRPQRGTSQQKGAMASLRRLFSFEPAAAVAREQADSGSATQPQQKPLVRPASAENRQVSQPTPPRSERAREATAATTNGLQEECPICRATFNSLSDLIAHSASHEGEAAPLPEICPRCQASFADPVALVEHVERQHSRPTACVLS